MTFPHDVEWLCKSTINKLVASCMCGWWTGLSYILQFIINQCQFVTFGEFIVYSVQFCNQWILVKNRQ